MSSSSSLPPATEAEPRDALEALYRAEYQKASDLAMLLTGNRAIAEELAQDAFVRVAPRVVEVDNPGGYLRTTLVNLCRERGLGGAERAHRIRLRRFSSRVRGRVM